MIINSITIDVEDWYHVCGVKQPPAAFFESRVLASTKRVLSLLDEFDSKATFFILGSVAASEPDLAPLIVDGGHEIASHGWSHHMVHELAPDEFCEEIEMTDSLILSQTGEKPVGFRAPQWSLNSRTAWGYEILADNGYQYDSSANPLRFVGDPGLPRHPYPVPLSTGSLWEIPPMITPSLFCNLPTGGGWGFRFFPEALITNTVDRLNRAGHPAVFYIHPRELDPQGPRLKLNPLKRFVSYGSRQDAAPRLRRLLSRYRFTTLKELVASWPSAS